MKCARIVVRTPASDAAPAGARPVDWKNEARSGFFPKEEPLRAFACSGRASRDSEPLERIFCLNRKHLVLNICQARSSTAFTVFSIPTAASLMLCASM